MLTRCKNTNNFRNNNGLPHTIYNLVSQIAITFNPCSNGIAMELIYGAQSFKNFGVLILIVIE